MSEPVAYSPREFAALFKKEQTWTYRHLYAGRIRSITRYGRILIPATEVERILASADRYEGKPTKPRTKKEIEALRPELQTAWQSFVERRRKGGPKNPRRRATPPPSNGKGSTRSAGLRRIAESK